ESFKVLVKEMQSLALDVRIFSTNREQLEIQEDTDSDERPGRAPRLADAIDFNSDDDADFESEGYQGRLNRGGRLARAGAIRSLALDDLDDDEDDDEEEDFDGNFDDDDEDVDDLDDDFDDDDDDQMARLTSAGDLAND
ncbi:MAG: hypothetical protein QM296_12235, partial [Bacillota bacterium]|nr:hypothetical protein [Bacillota bacterium]